jgi:hypothetical protein
VGGGGLGRSVETEKNERTATARRHGIDMVGLKAGNGKKNLTQIGI